LVNFETLAQDGIRVRANAGAASFHRRATLRQQLAAARAVVEELKREVDDDADASNRRIRAAKQRAARERAERVDAALKSLSEVEAQRKRREKKNAKQTEKQKEPRASTTEPQARVMKMADGGFRPAWNIQVVSVAEKQIVLAVEPGNIGSDRGLMQPMLQAACQRLGLIPKRHLADGGFASAKDIEWAHDNGVEVYCPPTKSKHGRDPFLPRPDDGPGVLAWRGRMASTEGQARYKRRAICECIHARWRHWNLKLNVRGTIKIRTLMLWHALANNILQGHRLAQAFASA